MSFKQKDLVVVIVITEIVELSFSSIICSYTAYFQINIFCICTFLRKKKGKSFKFIFKVQKNTIVYSLSTNILHEK